MSRHRDGAATCCHVGCVCPQRVVDPRQFVGEAHRVFGRDEFAVGVRRGQLIERDPHREGIDGVECEQRGLEFEPAAFEPLGLGDGIDAATVVGPLRDRGRFCRRGGCGFEEREALAGGLEGRRREGIAHRAGGLECSCRERARSSGLRSQGARLLDTVIGRRLRFLRSGVLEPRRVGRHGERRSAFGQSP